MRGGHWAEPSWSPRGGWVNKLLSNHKPRSLPDRNPHTHERSRTQALTRTHSHAPCPPRVGAWPAGPATHDQCPPSSPRSLSFAPAGGGQPQESTRQRSFCGTRIQLPGHCRRGAGQTAAPTVHAPRWSSRPSTLWRWRMSGRGRSLRWRGGALGPEGTATIAPHSGRHASPWNGCAGRRQAHQSITANTAMPAEKGTRSC